MVGNRLDEGRKEGRSNTWKYSGRKNPDPPGVPDQNKSGISPNINLGFAVKPNFPESIY